MNVARVILVSREMPVEDIRPFMSRMYKGDRWTSVLVDYDAAADGAQAHRFEQALLTLKDLIAMEKTVEPQTAPMVVPHVGQIVKIQWHDPLFDEGWTTTKGLRDDDLDVIHSAGVLVENAERRIAIALSWKDDGPNLHDGSRTIADVLYVPRACLVSIEPIGVAWE